MDISVFLSNTLLSDSGIAENYMLLSDGQLCGSPDFLDFLVKCFFVRKYLTHAKLTHGDSSHLCMNIQRFMYIYATLHLRRR